MHVEIQADDIVIESGEVVTGGGQAIPKIWLRAKGRRMHADSEPVEVMVFLDPDQAIAQAIGLIRESVLLDLALTLPTEGEPPHDR